MSKVKLNLGYYSQFDIGKPVSGGSLYVGVVDTDPEVVSNQKTITALQEDGSEVSLSQPVSLSAGGYPTYNGSPVSIFVVGPYSLKILNSLGAQEYYIPKNDIETAEVISVDTIADLANESFVDGALRIVKGRESYGDGAGGNFIFDSDDLSTEVTNDTLNGVYVPPNTDTTGASGAWVRTFSGSFNVKWFGAKGDGTTDDITAVSGCIDVAGSKSTIYFPDGTYVISDTIEITSQGVNIVGDGRDVSIVRSNGNFDAIHFHAPTASDDTPIFNCSLRHMSIESSSDSVTAIGLRVSRVTGFTGSDFGITYYLRGLVLEGTAQGNFDNFIISAFGYTGGALAAHSNIVISEYQSLQSSTYYQVWTTNFNNFTLGGNSKANSNIHIVSADGLNFSNGYAAKGNSFLVSFNESANEDLAAVQFNNVYFDGVSATPEALNIPASSVAEESAIIKFDNCIFGQTTAGASIGTEVKSLTLTNNTFANMSDNAIAINDAGDSGEIIISNNRFVNVGTDDSHYGIRVNNCGEVLIHGNIFSGIDGTSSAAISTAGTITSLSILGNHFKDCTDDLEHVATVGTFVYNDNITDVSGSALKTYGESEASFTAGTGTITIDSTKNTIAWNRVGRMVFIQGQLEVDSVSSPSGQLRIAGLPFAATSGVTEDGDTSALSIKMNILTGTLTHPIARIVGGGVSIIIEDYNGGSNQDNEANHMQSGAVVTIGGHYIADD